MIYLQNRRLLPASSDLRTIMEIFSEKCTETSTPPKPRDYDKLKSLHTAYERAQYKYVELLLVNMICCRICLFLVHVLGFTYTCSTALWRCSVEHLPLALRMSTIRYCHDILHLARRTSYPVTNDYALIVCHMYVTLFNVSTCTQTLTVIIFPPTVVPPDHPWQLHLVPPDHVRHYTWSP